MRVPLPLAPVAALGLLLLCCLPTTQAKDKTPFKKFAAAAAAAAAAASGHDLEYEQHGGHAADGVKNKPHPAHRALEPATSKTKLAFLQGVQKNGIDPVELFRTVIESEAFKGLLDNAEIQHRLLETMPHLGALPGFSDIKGRRLDDAGTTAGFAKGVAALMDYSKGLNKLKDPAYMLDVVQDLSKSSDPRVQALFAGAKQQDEASVEGLKALAAEKMFPGVDLEVREDGWVGGWRASTLPFCFISFADGRMAWCGGAPSSLHFPLSPFPSTLPCSHPPINPPSPMCRL